MDSIITDYTFKYYPNWQIEEKPNFSNNGLFDGDWESFYQSGEIQKKSVYLNGLKSGVWLSFHEDNRPNTYKFYNLDSLVTSYYYEYHKNLQIKEVPNFNDNGLFDGNWESFYRSGEVHKKDIYSNGLKNGVWLSFHEDNRLNTYKFYNLDSLVTYYDYEYFKNLQIKEKPSFNDDGLYDKQWTSFFKNGKTQKIFHYKNGIKSSLWTVFWDSTYNNHTETMYENDKRNGTYFDWYVNANPKEEGSYKNNKKDILWTYWNEFGERRFEEWSEGELLDSFEFEYYPNGQVKEEPSYENGKKHGEWVRYFPDGTVRGTSGYKEGLKDGVWIDYYRPEQIAFKGKYREDKKTGEWNWYWLNRTLMNKTVYNNDISTFEECYDRSTGNTRDCSKVFNPGDFNK
jgi:antitoxin component YwqK of YwqJK toxin-antitoxin module